MEKQGGEAEEAHPKLLHAFRKLLADPPHDSCHLLLDRISSVGLAAAGGFLSLPVGGDRWAHTRQQELCRHAGECLP